MVSQDINKYNTKFTCEMSMADISGKENQFFLLTCNYRTQ